MNNESQHVFVLNPPAASGNQQSSSLQKLLEMPANQSSNLEDIEDFSTVCRTCATITQCVIPIFSGEGLQNNLAEKIHKHLPIKVSPQDELPTAVCYQCAHTLLAWHELVACCEQADKALRTRHRQITATRPDVKPPRTEERTTENRETNRFEEIVDFVAAAIDPLPPPRYAPPAPLATPAPPLKACAYCPTHHTPDDYKAHVMSLHSDLIFHCDNCDSYIDKRDFVFHMSYHAIQYAAEVKNEEKKKAAKKPTVKDENQNGGLEPRVGARKAIKTEPPERAAKPDRIQNENEFSDHSDTENGFDPIPESVFEAIEDTQDGQAEESHTNDDEENDAEDEDSPPKKPAKNKKPRSRTCPICQKVYTAASSYFYHMKYSHKVSKDYECPTCQRKFQSKTCLNQHRSTHDATQKYKCKHCEKQFQTKASQYIHEQIHDGIKIFSCNQCQISFRWRTHLIRHMKRHAAERSHACPTCGKAFAIHCDLLRHLKTHKAGEFKCERCGVKFAQERYLKVHVKKHTKDN